MVEARRIELLSKSIATTTSPSAVSNLDFAPLTPTDRLRWSYLDKFPSKPPRISSEVSRSVAPYPSTRE